MKNLNISVFVAHMDDETFGMIGTLKKLSKHNNIFVHSMCKGRNEDNFKSRLEAFKYLGNKYSYKTSYSDFYDLELYKVQPSKLADIIYKKIQIQKPDIVFSTSKDLHIEHGFINTATKVAIRRVNIKKYFEIFIPGSSDITSFNPNTFIEIDLDSKLKDIQKYATEISQENFEQIRNYSVLFNNSEIFKLVKSYEI